MHKQFKSKSVNNLTELLIGEQLLSAAIRLLFLIVFKSFLSWLLTGPNKQRVLL
jgi:hypothetical protein